MRNSVKAVMKATATGKRLMQFCKALMMASGALDSFMIVAYNSASFNRSAFSATMRWSMQSWMSPSMKAARL